MTRPNILTPAVAQAIEEIRGNYPNLPITVKEDGQGGAIVIVDSGIDPGDIYNQDDTWVGFHITYQYPYSDVYPHFVRGDLSRKDGRPLGEATSVTTFEGRRAVQLSRRSNHLNPATDTAVLKLLKVLDWLGKRP